MNNNTTQITIDIQIVIANGMLHQSNELLLLWATIPFLQGMGTVSMIQIT